ncbi:MAG: glutaredoxin family protein [Pseudomonadota bacterium]
MIALTVYSRPGCHLCEQLIEALLPMVRDRATVTVVDIDTDPALKAVYDVRVPVLCQGDTLVCEAFIDPAAVEKLFT